MKHSFAINTTAMLNALKALPEYGDIVVTFVGINPDDYHEELAVLAYHNGTREMVVTVPVVDGDGGHVYYGGTVAIDAEVESIVWHGQPGEEVIVYLADTDGDTPILDTGLFDEISIGEYANRISQNGCIMPF